MDRRDLIEAALYALAVLLFAAIMSALLTGCRVAGPACVIRCGDAQNVRIAVEI